MTQNDYIVTDKARRTESEAIATSKGYKIVNYEVFQIADQRQKTTIALCMIVILFIGLMLGLYAHL